MLCTWASEDLLGASEGARAVVGLDETILGDRDSGRVCNGSAWLLDPLTDRLCFRLGSMSSVFTAAAAETPSPPLRRAFFRRSVASSKASLAVFRFLTGGSLMISEVSVLDEGRNTASISAPSASGEVGGVGPAASQTKSDDRAIA